MNKKVLLSVLYTVLVSILCNGINTDNLLKENLSLNSIEVLPGGYIYGKQQQMHERLEMQKMREKLTRYRIELDEYEEVSKELYKKVRFWFAYPISLTPAAMVFGFFLFGDFFKALYRYHPDFPPDEVIFSLKKILCGLITGTIAGGLTFAALSIQISHILSIVKAGWIFNEWNRKNQLEGYLTEDKVAIESLGTQLFEEELNLLLQEEGNREARQLLFDILRTKKN